MSKIPDNLKAEIETAIKNHGDLATAEQIKTEIARIRNLRNEWKEKTRGQIYYQAVYDKFTDAVLALNRKLTAMGEAQDKPTTRQREPKYAALNPAEIYGALFREGKITEAQLRKYIGNLQKIKITPKNFKDIESYVEELKKPLPAPVPAVPAPAPAPKEDKTKAAKKAAKKEEEPDPKTIVQEVKDALKKGGKKGKAAKETKK